MSGGGGAGVGPRTLLRWVARAEMVTWAGLIAAMVLKYGAGLPGFVPVAGGVHGFVFLSYLLAVLLLWVDQRWGAARGLAGMGSSFVPFLTVPFERALARRGEPAERWRLRSATPARAAERVVALVLGRPVAAAVCALVIVAVVFTLLLLAGPPTQWFGR